MYSLCLCQMWMSVWRGLTTATLMLSARTPHGPTSASASLATQGMVNTAKVRRLGGRREQGELPERRSPCHCLQLATLRYTKACTPTGMAGRLGAVFLPRQAAVF